MIDRKLTHEREMAEVHQATCRARRLGVGCSTCSELDTQAAASEQTAPLTVESARAAWDDVKADIQRHWFWCEACRPTIAVCTEGQGLAEAERAAYSLLRRARAAEGGTP